MSSGRRSRIYLAIDVSLSMGERHDVRALVAEILAGLATMGSGEVGVIDCRCLAFGKSPRWLSTSPMALTELQLSNLRFEGPTALGAALVSLATQVESDVRESPDLRPILILVSDGRSTLDEPDPGLCRVHEIDTPGQVHIAASPSGDSDFDVLRRFVGDRGPEPFVLPSSAS